jgi:hypothetical protein
MKKTLIKIALGVVVTAYLVAFTMAVIVVALLIEA